MAWPDIPAERLLVFTTASTEGLLEVKMGDLVVEPEKTILRTGSKQEKSAMVGNVRVCGTRSILTT